MARPPALIGHVPKPVASKGSRHLSPAALRPEPYEHKGVAGVLLYNVNDALFGWTPAAEWGGEAPAEMLAAE